eukprot:1188799-Prorocentrum_minimum.AAC.1
MYGNAKNLVAPLRRSEGTRGRACACGTEARRCVAARGCEPGRGLKLRPRETRGAWLKRRSEKKTEARPRGGSGARLDEKSGLTALRGEFAALTDENSSVPDDVSLLAPRFVPPRLTRA